MNIVCASICYRGFAEDEVAETLKRAPAAGYRFMEIHGPTTGNPEAVEAFDVQEIKKSIERAGMKCVGVYPPNWGGADDAEVMRRAKAIARCVEIVRELGGDHVSTTGASLRGEAGALDRVVQCVREVLRLIGDESVVKLTLEQPEDFERVLYEIPDPRVGICIDTGHFHSARVDTIALIRRHASRIFAVHLKDHIVTVSVGIGRGEIDLASTVAALRAINYPGDLTIELEVEDS